MNIPIITPDQIKITERAPEKGDALYGSYTKLIASISWHESCLVSTAEGFRVEDFARKMGERDMKFKIMRKLYPREIGQAIHEIRVEFCANPAIPTPIARRLQERLGELENALRPSIV